MTQLPKKFIKNIQKVSHYSQSNFSVNVSICFGWSNSQLNINIKKHVLLVIFKHVVWKPFSNYKRPKLDWTQVKLNYIGIMWFLFIFFFTFPTIQMVIQCEKLAVWIQGNFFIKFSWKSDWKEFKSKSYRNKMGFSKSMIVIFSSIFCDI